MNRAQYQEAIKQYIYTPDDRAVDYISLQLVSEVGELLGGFAKRLVGREITDEYLNLEAGDICFFLAWSCLLVGISFESIPTSAGNDASPSKTAEQTAFYVASLVRHLRNDWRDGVKTCAGEILYYVTPFFPAPLEDILQMNIDKLEARKNGI